VIQKENFIFLDQEEYTRQVGVSPMSDFRYLYRADFSIRGVREENDILKFVLMAVKPSRISK
jgi:hypothetical protein